MCSHIPAKLGDEGVLALVRAISAMDNKRYRDAGGAKSASLSKRLTNTYICAVGMGAFYRSHSIGHPTARQVCLAPLLIRRVAAEEDRCIRRMRITGCPECKRNILLLGAGFLSAVCGCYFVELDLFGLRTHTAYLIPFHFGKIPKSLSRVQAYFWGPSSLR